MRNGGGLREPPGTALGARRFGRRCRSCRRDRIAEVTGTKSAAEFAYRFDTALTGSGSLDIEWRDFVGRMVERRRIPLNLADVAEVVFSLDLRRAVTPGNQLVAHLSLEGVEQTRGNRHRENELSTSFIVPPAANPWTDYQIIMWQGQTPAGYATLKKLGVTAGMVQADHRNEASTSMPGLARLVDADLRCYHRKHFD